MSGIKEVIRVLGFIQEYFDNNADEQEPNKRKELFWDWSDTVLEAITLLKAQEPRVMSLDELSEETNVYFESLVYDTICPALSDGSYDDGTVGLMTLEDELFYMDEADYGVQWRCWISRPTYEQMEATPWN